MATKKGGKAAAGKRGRSAVTGQIVKQSTVKAEPRETVNETVKKSGSKKSGKKK